MRLLTILTLSMVLTAGCATKRPNVANDHAIYTQAGKRLGVAQVKTPSPYTHKMGAQGLLDIAINNAIASSLTTHLKTVDFSKIDELDDGFYRYLESDADIEVVKIEDIDVEQYPTLKESGLAYSDYSALAASKKLDYLLLIQTFGLGSIRDYYGFIPTSKPRGYVRSSGQLIDLKTNELKWHHVVDVQQVITGSATWGDDSKENGYPALSAAFIAAVEQAAEKIESDFYKGSGKQE